MKYLCFLLLLMLESCSFDYDYEIKEFYNRTLTYEKLPTEVKACMIEKMDSFDITKYHILYVNESDSSIIKAESVGTIIGPESWIAYVKLIYKRKNIVYKLDREIPEPYILFKNKLYIPKEYNIWWTYDKISYDEYELK